MASRVVVVTAIASYLYLDYGLGDDLIPPPGLEESREGAITDTSSTTSTTAPPPPVTPVNVLLVGDSVLAGLRWFEQGTVALQGFAYTLDAESCRRLSFDSCQGREARIPNSATSVVQGFAAPVDVVVLVAGYHADIGTIREELQWFAAAVAAKNAKLVILTFKESLAYPSPGSDGTRSIFADFNETIRAMAAEGVLGNVTIADWNLFSQEGSAWFRSDAMHPNLAGTLAMGWFISATLASMFNNPCPVWGTYPCVVPAIHPDIDWLNVYGVPYTETHCYEDGVARVRVCAQDRQL
jgi:hypothetical protein